MDTAVQKSWCEIVRRTDPLIWALVMESSPSEQENNVNTILPSPPSAPVASIIASLPATRAGSELEAVATSLSQDILVGANKMFTSIRDSHCRSLLEPPQPQNGLDWLKCLIMSTPPSTNGDYVYSKRDSRKLQQRGSSLDIQGDSDITRCALTGMARDNEMMEVMVSKRASSASNSAKGASGPNSLPEKAPGSKGSSRSTPNNSKSRSSSKLPSSPESTSKNTHRNNASTSSNNNSKNKNNNNNKNQNAHCPKTFNQMYYATSASSETVSPAHFGSRMNEDHYQHQYHAGANASSSNGQGAIISNSIATMATAAVANHVAVEAASASAAAALSSTELQQQGSESNSDAADHSNNTNNMADANNSITFTTIDTNTVTTPVISLDTNNNNNNNNNNDNKNDHRNNSSMSMLRSGRIVTFLPFLSTVTLDSATTFLVSTLTYSKDATTAFLYRTFSPTYRILTLYKNSWSDGSQLRGLNRIKNSFLNADAVTLVKTSANQMKDVWKQVMVAYSVKAKDAKAKKEQTERAKALKEAKTRVQEAVQSKKDMIEKEKAKVTEKVTEAKDSEGKKKGGNSSGSEGGFGEMGGGFE
ncbi:hypothetical protein FBU30_008995 [Linnemannia zychae]|nr:hypothetical protein FBU30_008995 [Linnemannia zychae]